MVKRSRGSVELLSPAGEQIRFLPDTDRCSWSVGAAKRPERLFRVSDAGAFFALHLSRRAARSNHQRRVARSMLAAFAGLLCTAAGSAAQPLPPSIALGPLYESVALSPLFPDGKIWADATPKRAPAAILLAYRKHGPWSEANLRTFLDANFIFERPGSGSRRPTPCLQLEAHISELWPILTRRSATVPRWSSLLPLPHPYVVPGGRFTEIYYWDSYFTMLGMGPAEAALRRGMVANFAHLIRIYGHIPNGNRSYYLSRSQPPFFFKMVELTDPAHPAKAFAANLPALRAEYAFWMKGAGGLKRNEASDRVVRMPDGSLLNRYWDDRATPRDEAYAVDFRTAQRGGRPAPVIYRNLRAAAESGWDFSSRWLADRKSLNTVRTGDIVPPDLNGLLFGLERAIAQGCAAIKDRACLTAFRDRARAREEAMRHYLWNGASGLYDDYLWRERRLAGNISAASLYPLFFRLANRAEADRTAETVERELVKSGGLVTTNVTTGQQWDAPNGWAPLQWIAVNGLRAYDQERLARIIATRWLRTVASTYARTGKLLEKYDVVTLRPGGGGEYPLQDGFGWTNGTTIALLKLYPDWRASFDASGVRDKLPAPLGPRAEDLRAAPTDHVRADEIRTDPRSGRWGGVLCRQRRPAHERSRQARVAECQCRDYPLGNISRVQTEHAIGASFSTTLPTNCRREGTDERG